MIDVADILDTVICGELLDVLPTIPNDVIDTTITDAPYGLKFMGKKWDYDVPSVEEWQEVLRVMKPGATLLCFAGSRTQHRMACNVEDAGFILKDCIMWLYGSGFPKATDISKQLDKGHEREVVGYNKNHRTLKATNTMVGEPHSGDGNITAPATPEAKLWNGWKSHGLKPAYEPILVAMKPNEGTYAENALKWGVSGLNIEGGKIGTEVINVHHFEGDHAFDKGRGEKPYTNHAGRFPANIILDEYFIPVLCLTSTSDAGIVRAIKEFYHAYELPDVPTRVQGISESGQGRSQEILQQNLLPQSSVNTNDGEGASDVRQETQSGVNRENEGLSQESCEAGEGQSCIQRGVHVKGVSPYQSAGIKPNRKANGPKDAAKREGCNSRTSLGNGNEAGKAVEAIRNSASQKRDKGRQQAGKPRIPDQLNPQDEPQANLEGTPAIAKRERRLEVLDCDIPDQWLKYFEPTGYEIRDPNCAARMLDEQSGETGAHGGQGDFAQHSWMKNDTPQDIQRSSGGASRFFYTAKASKAERNAGCEGMEATEYQMHRPPDSDPAKVPLVNKNYHPTVKPVALMEYLCKLTATPTGGIVLDPFAGSGSTGIAAYKTNRGYVLIDKDPDYCKIAEKRIQDERDKFALFEQNP